jgi:hypothetical protein
MNVFRAVVSVIVVIVFVAFGVFLVVNADTTNQTEWERWVYVFGAAEAIGFTAIGWIFGKEVNRQRAEEAEKTAKAADGKAAAEQSKGSALAGLVAGAAGAPGERRRIETLGPGEGGNMTAALQYAKEHYGV